MSSYKKIIFSGLFLLAAITAGAQTDTTAVSAITFDDKPQTAPVEKPVDTLSTAQRLIQMQEQMVELQRSMNQLQQTMNAATAKKEILPTDHKKSSHFYASLQFGFFFNKIDYALNPESKEKIGTRFSYSLKPAFGYLFTPRLTAGCTVIFSDYKFSGMSSSSAQYIIAMAMTNGIVSLSDYLSWNVQPYVRYKITKVFWERVNLWADFSMYAGQQIPRDSNSQELLKDQTSTTFGVKLSPMLTIDLNKNRMLFTTFNFLSWNGTCRVDGDTRYYNNSVNFQFIPIYSILSGIFNIGMIRKF